ncbi:MAG: NADPH-dependent oxidoreductase, partial [Muribaculaceae bacterium]|nr:NADPH-dependent oxidoreductase [Muribaculaceae bacterium]
PEKIAELLKLPKGTFVVCGLAVGVPREQPDVKPKQGSNLLIHQNHYREDDMTQELLEYDEVVSKYNRTRSGTTSENDWGGHIVDYYHAALSYRIKDYLISQGFGFVK